MSLSDRMNLAGKVALIAGGAGGIGAAIANGLIEAGAKVVLGDNVGSVGDIASQMSRNGSADWVSMDVTKSGSVDEAVAHVVNGHGSWIFLLQLPALPMKNQPSITLMKTGGASWQ
ncbi:SDR family NAD(P)-dependent oxidoreductase [Rhizobium leguminosarum]|nr:SDR family NAD(P)-dependent oxidoreductase [Rhizobium leguminosarum]MBY5434406.1 SDR family NAD(P)-dependent oxidoreductase [Rhizobium leguminosarum]